MDPKNETSVAGDPFDCGESDAPLRYTLGDKWEPIWVPTAGKGDQSKTWYCMPSLRIHFDADVLISTWDVRLHKSVTPDDGWVLSEGTTGYRIYAGFGDHGHAELIDMFLSFLLPKLTPEIAAAALAKAREYLIDFPRRPA
jgi:hypothetical protein